MGDVRKKLSNWKKWIPRRFEGVITVNKVTAEKISSFSSAWRTHVRIQVTWVEGDYGENT